MFPLKCVGRFLNGGNYIYCNSLNRLPLIPMIKIIKNANLPQWFQITFTDTLGFFDILDEVKGRAKAMKIAKKLAYKEGVNYVNVDGFIMETREL
jgi:hypothetical protein